MDRPTRAAVGRSTCTGVCPADLHDGTSRRRLRDRERFQRGGAEPAPDATGGCRHMANAILGCTRSDLEAYCAEGRDTRRRRNVARGSPSWMTQRPARDVGRTLAANLCRTCAAAREGACVAKRTEPSARKGRTGQPDVVPLTIKQQARASRRSVTGALSSPHSLLQRARRIPLRLGRSARQIDRQQGAANAHLAPLVRPTWLPQSLDFHVDRAR